MKQYFDMIEESIIKVVDEIVIVHDESEKIEYRMPIESWDKHGRFSDLVMYESMERWELDFTNDEKISCFVYYLHDAIEEWLNDF